MNDYFYRLIITDRNDQVWILGEDAEKPGRVGEIFEAETDRGFERFRLTSVHDEAAERGNPEMPVNLFVTTWTKPAVSEPQLSTAELEAQVRLLAQVPGSEFSVDCQLRVDDSGNGEDFFVWEHTPDGSPMRLWRGVLYERGRFQLKPVALGLNEIQNAILQRHCKSAYEKMKIADEKKRDTFILMDMRDEPALFPDPKRGKTASNLTGPGMIRVWQALTDICELSGWSITARHSEETDALEIVASRHGSRRDHRTLRRRRPGQLF